MSSRVSLPSSPGHQSEEEVVEPPAGLAFSALASNTDASPGYHVLPSADWASQSNLRTKVRHARRAGFRSNANNQVQVGRENFENCYFHGRYFVEFLLGNMF